MKDFNSYIPENEPEKQSVSGAPDDTSQNAAMDMVKRIASQYHGKSEGEMLAAIFQEAEKGRKAGTLSDAEIDKFAATISPFIDSDKRKKLNSIIKKLKKS